jgi:phosphate transport system substrate-binding protein
MTKIPPIAYIGGLALVGAAAFLGSKMLSAPKSSLSGSQAIASNAPPAKVSAAIRLRVDGSTSMVTLNSQIKSLFPADSKISLMARGTGAGISALSAGSIDVAAISRPLTEAEQAKGLQQLKAGQDTIAFVVGASNPVRDISSAQLRSIFKGNIKNWQALGGENKPFNLIQRPKNSGTWATVSAAIGVNQQVGTILKSDGTTLMIQQLKADGLGYGTLTQLNAQSTAIVLTIDGRQPDEDGYPTALSRDLYYATKGEPTPDAAAFINAAKDILN